MSGELAISLSSWDRGFKPTWQLFFAPLPTNYPRNLLLLVVLVLLNHLVAVGELVCAIWTHSLGLFSHGSHMIFNGVILTGLLASVLANWQEHKRYSLCYIDLVARLNLALGCVLLCGASIVGYMSLRDASAPSAIIRGESLIYLVPVPALLLNLVAIYVILYGHDEEEEEEEEAGWTGPAVSPERRALERRTSKCVRQHLMANALGSVGTIAATISVQLLGWVVADTLCSGFVVVLMFVCAALLIREALEMVGCTRSSQP